jgi:hypothetical protein
MWPTYRDSVQGVTWNVTRFLRSFWFLLLAFVAVAAAMFAYKYIIPPFILNYLRGKVEQPFDGPLRPATINQGAIYQETTGHAPTDMRAVIAGVHLSRSQEPDPEREMLTRVKNYELHQRLYCVWLRLIQRRTPNARKRLCPVFAGVTENLY